PLVIHPFTYTTLFRSIYDDATFGERAQKKALPWDTIKTAPYKPEGKFSANTLVTLNQQSKIRQQQNPHFVYLSTLNDIRNMEDRSEEHTSELQSRFEL